MSQVEVMMIQGEIVNIFDDDDFVQMLREKLGDDAARYFLDRTNQEMLDAVMYDLNDSEILNRGYCSGECDKVQETQEHYEDLLKEIDGLSMAVYQKILDGYQIGSSRRTKKEQYALDKVIEIHKIVKRNT